MMRSFQLKVAFGVAAWTLALGASAQATAVLTLDPLDGAVAGPAGTTVGWGFTLTNTADFLVVTGSDFCVGMLTSPCSNSFGTYTDFAGAQFFVVGPSPEETLVIQSFDDTAMTGIGSFAIDPASVGTLDGYIAMTYDLYSVDPNSPSFDPTMDTLETGQYLYAPASVTVGTIVPTPEPRMLWLLLCALPILWVKKKLRVRAQI